MNLFSSSSTSSASNFSVFSHSSQNPNPSKFHHFKSTIKIPHLPPPLSSHQSSPPPIPQQKPQSLNCTDKNGSNEQIETTTMSSDELLVVRRPVMEIISVEDEVGDVTENDERASEEEEDDDDELPSSTSPIDERLSKFAKKMPIFEPEMRVELSPGEVKPLLVNLDLALYRVKILTRKFQYDEAQNILQKCILYWPEDGRPYVALGKILSRQSKPTEARAVYEKGCQATQGENPYIWQCWAVLENNVGNIRRARELFDAATVADKKHIAAWHGWAVLELKEGNIKKARNLLGKGIKYCGGNEYVYQTLALLEVRASRYEQARYLFRQATKCNPNSCASWLAWAQLEMQQENNRAARQLFEKAVQASPKNRFAWHVWGAFEANRGNIEFGRKLLKIGHAVNPRDPVLLQSLALLEYKYSTTNLARALFRKASQVDPRHQPVWIAWGWMEWKEGNIETARELYERALTINSSTESAARCLQAWGVLEQRAGNLSAARRLFRASLNINSQSYVTWMTWASLEEDQGNSIRAEEIRNLYFQQRTEVADDASWVTGFLDIIDPAIGSIKRLLNLDENSFYLSGTNEKRDEQSSPSDDVENETGFDLDGFISVKLLLDPSKLDVQLETSTEQVELKTKSWRRAWRSEDKTAKTLPKLGI
ncbi:protein high chlorophyll fluorescent 107 [Rhododendron vialii]|uniref:protein high chlorophyll fluorescent 107 n=1 Tax=Rhododendron vialii TaxID=182163 RepID=UPI0026600A32|nr:protein high chlorophyll fluorescent 107 [Rhododendron vialii]XP_058201146.1 protein high chlorophyll fluorescent 107 [Rhododendron vialii]